MLEVGQMVRLKVPLLGQPAGSIGYVFSDYPDFDFASGRGAQIVLPDGSYDGFSVREQELYLEIGEVVPEYSTYSFRNVMALSRDFRAGVWDFNREFIPYG